MKIKSSVSLFAALALLLCTATANAAYVQLVPPQANDGSIDLPPAGFTATYAPAASVSSIWFNDSVSPQSPANVAQTISDQFGIVLDLVGQDDDFESSESVSLGSGFNVLAVHLGGQGGGNELLFFFNTPITSFDVETFSAGGSSNLSNFRAYSVVPVPAAVWLMVSGLFGLGFMRRRK